MCLFTALSNDIDPSMLWVMVSLFVNIADFVGKYVIMRLSAALVQVMNLPIFLECEIPSISGWSKLLVCPLAFNPS